MRLLQLATGPDRLIDLHPNVTVVAGLDGEARHLLAETVAGLARGVAPGVPGLLEAHGVLFDLSNDMLALLDVSADGLRPVVEPADLPTKGHDPRAADRAVAERNLAELEERCATAIDESRRRQAARDAAAEVLEHARRNAHEADAGAAERIRLIDELTAQLDQAEEQRRRLLEEQAARRPELEEALARRVEVEGATADVRGRHQEAALRCSELAGRLDQARSGLDPDAVDAAAQAAAELARVEAEVTAEREAEAAAGDGQPEPDEPPTERLARVQARIEELEKRLAAFGPTEIHTVSNALEQLRARQDGELVPSAEAQALADQLAELDADLAATAGVGATSGGLQAGRSRLDDARHALLEAEQAARNPELDRELVDRLEHAHAELLDAIDKADGRFAGARAQRRVESAREAEHALLEQLGFASYSDYMMGYSLLNVDPDKEAALEASRAELSAAEDAWRVLQAETDAELARAERMERRRQLLDHARALLDRPVAASAAVAELRAHRVPASLPPELVTTLQATLDEAGLAVSGEELSREELMLLAEAWLDEAADATAREQDVRAELAGLAAERDDALASIEREAARAAVSDGPTPEEDRRARLEGARGAAEHADARRQAHLAAESAVADLTRELAEAADAERLAAEASADADAAVAEAIERAEGLAADLERIAGELEAVGRDEADAKEHLQSLTDHESATPEDLASELEEAELVFAGAEAELRSALEVAAALDREREAAQAEVESLRAGGGGDPVDEGSIAEEIEWYLLARLAAQRSVSLAGSVPLLLDDALVGLDEAQLAHVLGRLERMADAVQVIVVSDDPLAASWALMAGQDRAAVIRPEPS